MYTTKVSKRMIEDLIENLQGLVDTMEDLEVDAVETECNTYFCKGSNFISFTGIGYLPIQEDYYGLVEEEKDLEEGE